MDSQSKLHSAAIGDVLPLDVFPSAQGNVIRIPHAEPVEATTDLDSVLYRVLTDEPMVQFSFRTFERTAEGWRRTE